MGIFFNLESIPLRENEDVLKIVRRVSWLVFVFLIFPFLLLTVDFFFLFQLFQYGTIGIVLFFSVLALSIVWILRICIRWFGSTLIVTSERIIDRSHEGLFHSSLSEIAIADLRDVAVVQRGVLATLGRYGTLTFRQAGVPLLLVFSYAHAPHTVQRFITDTIHLRQKNSSSIAPSPFHGAQETQDPGFDRQVLKMLYERLGKEKILAMLSDFSPDTQPSSDENDQ